MAATSSYAELLQRLREYRDDRHWRQFHTPKDLAIAVSTEAGELLELALWREDAEVRERLGEVASEIADVAIYLMFLCDALGIDLLETVHEKLETNLGRHPIDAARGRSRVDS